MPPRRKPGVGLIAPTKSEQEGEMARLAPESKMIGRHSAMPPGSSKREVSIPPWTDVLYAVGDGQFSADGSSWQLKLQSTYLTLYKSSSSRKSNGSSGSSQKKSKEMDSCC